MSRCYPFPPPGYIQREIRDEAAIESIKLQRAAEKKQKKKERKRGKKEKDKAQNNGDVESKKHKNKRRHKEEGSQEDKVGGGYEKRKQSDVDCLEKSSLTEEHGHPVPVGSQNSMDSTFNSNKRPKLTLNPVEPRHNSGHIIRIKLSTPRHKDPMVPGKEQLCSPLGRTNVASVSESVPVVDKEPCTPSRNVVPELTVRLSKDKQLSEPCTPSRNIVPELTVRFSKDKQLFEPRTPSVNVVPELTIRLSKDKQLSAAVAAEVPAPKVEPELPSNSCGNCSSGFLAQPRDLIEKFVPLPLQLDDSELDESWLFERKKDCNKKASRSEAGENLNGDVLAYDGSSPYPHAHYLLEASIYALPYVLPF